MIPSRVGPQITANRLRHLVILQSLVVVSVLLTLPGCVPSSRPPLGRVSGTVRLDGESLANATVLFTPAGQGRTSQGVTDSHGRYELRYLRDIPGANIDQHTVRITTACEENGGRELLPARYNARTDLEARVIAGRNVFDFELRSHAP
jgi:hypothetical protein